MTVVIKVLYLAAEAEPFVKIGGLGDVASSLPRALRGLSAKVTGGIKVDIRLVLPLHPVIQGKGLRPLGMFSLPHAGNDVQVEAFEGWLEGMPVYFLDGEPIRNSGSVYSADPDMDAGKYIFFSLAALELPRQIDWSPDIIHANDWHTALAVYGSLTKRWEEGARHVASVLTIHNLSYVGPNISSKVEDYGVKLAQTDLPDWARQLPLPLGLWASDAMVAVSPSYAEEMLTPEFGNGLDGFLHTRRPTLHGILNGLDIASFNPADDNALEAPYTNETIENRQENKAALQKRLGLPSEPETPVMAMVSRMDPHKGVDLALKSLRALSHNLWQAVILGTGNPKLEQAAVKLQADFPGRVRVETRYDGELARQIYGGADLLLMPSRYEPCGLSQMIAMRYGCVPLVRAVGGLKDTVRHYETGFVFQESKQKALNDAIRDAIKVYKGRTLWRKIQFAGMSQDFSWNNSAMKYLELYRTLIPRSKT